jgi:hypothetical protein
MRYADFGRALRSLPLALLLAAAAPALATSAFAADNEVSLVEMTAPAAGRPAEMLVTGVLDGGDPYELESVTFEDGALVIVIVARFHFYYHDRFAYPFELPPLPVGNHPVILKTRSYTSGVLAEAARTSLVVPPPARARLEPLGGGFYQLRLSGGVGWIYPGFEEEPTFGDGKIHFRISFDCVILCGREPPEPGLLSPPFGPLPAGVYQLEVENLSAFYPRSPIFLRQELEAFDDEVLVRGGRFEIEVELTAHQEKPRLAAPPSADAALFYFFSPDNWEAMVKVLDGCALNGHYWVYAAASTDVGYTLRVTDREAGGTVKEYRHEGGAPAPALTDALAFPCS